MSFHVKMAPNGRIVVPADVRRKLGLEQGGDLMIEERDDGTLVLKSRLQALSEVQQHVRELVNGRSGFSVDDFIAERRLEAAKEH